MFIAMSSFEPATGPALSVNDCVGNAQACFERGIPAIVSVHSINFHSSVSGFRDSNISAISTIFFRRWSRVIPDLLYLRDVELLQLVEKGCCQTPQGDIRFNVTKKKFTRRNVERSIDPRQRTG